MSVVASATTNQLFVANAGANSISIIDGATNTIKQVISVGSDPARLTVSPDGKLLMVSNAGDGTVTFVNVGVTPAVTLGPLFVGGEPMGGAIRNGNRIVFVNNLFCPTTPSACNPDGHTSNGVIEVVDRTALEPATCCIVVGQLPGAAGLDTIGRYLWVINYGSSNASIIDTFNNTVVATAMIVDPGQEWMTYGDFVTSTQK